MRVHDETSFEKELIDTIVIHECGTPCDLVSIKKIWYTKTVWKGW